MESTPPAGRMQERLVFLKMAKKAAAAIKILGMSTRKVLSKLYRTRPSMPIKNPRMPYSMIRTAFILLNRSW